MRDVRTRASPFSSRVPSKIKKKTPKKHFNVLNKHINHKLVYKKPSLFSSLSLSLIRKQEPVQMVQDHDYLTKSSTIIVCYLSTIIVYLLSVLRWLNLGRFQRRQESPRFCLKQGYWEHRTEKYWQTSKRGCGFPLLLRDS